MQKIIRSLIILVLCSALAQSSPASVLLFKAEKEIKGGLIGELANFDAAKYRQLRVLILRDYEVPRDVEKVEYYFANFYAVDGAESIWFLGSGRQLKEYSSVIDTPPPRVKISVTGQGKYKIFVWASQ
jgi:hypothetical protein